jgi:hypothetical protein
MALAALVNYTDPEDGFMVMLSKDTMDPGLHGPSNHD